MSALSIRDDERPMVREFAHQARRHDASRLRNASRGYTAAGDVVPPRDVVVPDCRLRGFRMAVFSPDPTWSEWT